LTEPPAIRDRQPILRSCGWWRRWTGRWRSCGRRGMGALHGGSTGLRRQRFRNFI